MSRMALGWDARSETKQDQFVLRLGTFLCCFCTMMIMGETRSWKWDLPPQKKSDMAAGGLG